MSILQDLKTRAPEGPLYHYTTQNGLLGIIKNKEIWATHTQYLNDHKEFIHAIDLVKRVIEDIKPGHDDDLENSILSDMQVGINGRESINVCVCSFSEEPDSLSQWRAYGGSSGFSIGFDCGYLRNIVEKRSFILTPCLYEEPDQVALLKEVVESVLETNIKLVKEDKYKDRPKGGDFCAVMNEIAPIIKNQTFKEEKEWRIISRPLACSFDEFDFREGKSMLIPYYRVPLYDNESQFSIENLVVGPTPNLNQSVSSANSFLVKHDFDDVEVVKTNVPFRDW